MRWICPSCGRSLSLGSEECPYCAAQPAPPPPPPGNPAGPRKVRLGKDVKWSDVRRWVDVLIGAALLLVTLYFVLLMGWPNLLPW